MGGGGREEKGRVVGGGRGGGGEMRVDSNIITPESTYMYNMHSSKKGQSIVAIARVLSRLEHAFVGFQGHIHPLFW